MSTTRVAQVSRQTAILAAIAVLHVGVLMLVVGGARISPPIQWTPTGVVVVRLPEPAPTTATPPDPVHASEYMLRPLEEPVLNFGRDEEQAPWTEGERESEAGTEGLSPGPPAPVYREPALLTGDSRMTALINSCYPAAARRKDQEGRGVVRVVVDAAGRASDWRVEQSTGFPSLDPGMGCVASRVRFEPGRRDGRAVEATVLMPFVFRLH